MTFLAALPLLLGPDPQLPTMQQAEDALLLAWSCVDEDGFTMCDPSLQPTNIEFTRFDCQPESPIAGERARATCMLEGRLQRLGIRRQGSEGSWQPITLLTATFWIDDRPGWIWRTER